VPRLQAVGDVCTFLRWQRKFPIPSSAAFGRIGDDRVKSIYGCWATLYGADSKFKARKSGVHRNVGEAN
jgi:hypothetical protein